MDKCLALLVVSLVLSGTVALKLPDYIKKCSIKDPEFNKCALKNARQAIPHLVKGERKHNIPALDPLLLKEIRVIDGQLNMAGMDINVEGIKHSVLENISFDFDKKKITAEVTVPEAYFTGRYEVTGKLVALPISGKGTFESTFYDLYVKYTTGYDLAKTDDGEVYLALKDYEMHFEPKEVESQVHNLFNGNKVLGDAMNKFINENWREVFKQIGKPTYDAVGLVVHTILTEAAKTVPYKDIFDDTEI